MEAAASFSANPKLPLRRISTKPSYHNTTKLITIRKHALILNAKKGDVEEGEHHQSLDEKRIVLRINIKKMKVLQAIKNQDHHEKARKSSSSSSESESNLLLNNYQEEVFEAIGLLRSYFMKSKPSVAFGVLVLVAMSTVPLSSSHAVFLENLLKLVKGLLTGFHVCIDIDF